MGICGYDELLFPFEDYVVMVSRRGAHLPSPFFRALQPGPSCSSWNFWNFGGRSARPAGLRKRKRAAAAAAVLVLVLVLVLVAVAVAVAGAAAAAAAVVVVVGGKRVATAQTRN